MQLVFLVVFPFVASVLAALMPTNARNRESTLAGLTALGCAAQVAWFFPKVKRGDVLRQEIGWLPSLGLDLSFRMALTVTGVSGLCLLVGVLLLGGITGSYELDVVLASGDVIRAHPLHPTLLLTTVLVVLGAAFAAIGSFGLVRLPTFFRRIHALTLGATAGVWCVVLATIVFFSARDGELLLHALLISLFIGLTAPATTIFLMRAALFRERQKKRSDVPPTVRSGPGRTS